MLLNMRPTRLPAGQARHALLLSALGCMTVHAAGIVTTCADDDSAGALRQVANDGGNVDLTQLPGCSNIILSAGTLEPLHPPALLGPADKAVTISANFGGTGALLRSLSIGTLTLSHVTMNGNGHPGLQVGHTVGVVLDHATITGSDGGAIVNAGSVSMTASSVSQNPATAPCTLCGYDAISTGQFTCVDSTISGNAVGGVSFLHYEASLIRCTVDSNGGDGITGGGSGGSINVVSSTISGNAGVGVSCTSPFCYITQSTITNNNIGVQSTHKVHLYSSIVARNTTFDLSITTASGYIYGSSNLVMTWQTDNALAGQPFITTADPRISPLAWHGGPTRTHALLADSPALDIGDNPGMSATDQRGPGFTREVPTGEPDIGAYERQAVDDEIFYDGYEQYQSG